MTTIYLVRHGETVENAEHILQGHRPGQLTEQGKQQAEALREELKELHFDALVCSDLKRCVDTATLLNADRKLPLLTTPLLRERDWGDFTGRYIPDIQHTPLPGNVESIEAMRRRAQSFLDFIRTHYAGQCVLAVGHGLMNRAIQAVHYKKEMHEIERMGNATFRILELQESE